MAEIPGVRPSRPSELVRVQDRISFVYVERATIGRDDSAITATDDAGVIHIPAASLGALLLGPGTRVTHQAMLLLADSGSTAVWVGERGVRYYAHGRPLGRTTRPGALGAHRSRVAASRLRPHRLRLLGCDQPGTVGRAHVPLRRRSFRSRSPSEMPSSPAPS